MTDGAAEACVKNLEQAVHLDENAKEMGHADDNLEWARQDERVRKLLDMTDN